MRIAIVGALAVVALAGSMNAQTCGLINDEAGVIKDASVIKEAAKGLLNQGAVVHVITLTGTTAPSQMADVYLKRCPEWQNKQGRLAANQFILLVNPTARQKSAVFGADYAPVFPRTADGSQATIYSKAANPSFAEGDYQAGLASALTAFSSRVAAFNDQAQHPVQQSTIINNAAPAPQPESHFGYVFLFLIALAAAIWLVIFLLRKRKDDSEAASQAQQEASAAQQRADTLFRVADSNSPSYPEVAAQYQALSNSVTYDPNANGQSAASYNTMTRAWNNLCDDLKALRSPRSTPSSRVSEYEAPAPKVRAAAASAGNHHSHYTPPTPVTPPTPPTPAQPTVIHNTTYVDRSGGGNDLLTGMLIGDELSRSRYDRGYDDTPRYEAPSRSRDEDDNSSSGSTSSWSAPSSNDDSSSGDTSSWSSSDDSSSSSDSSSDSSSGDDSSF